MHNNRLLNIKRYTIYVIDTNKNEIHKCIFAVIVGELVGDANWSCWWCAVIYHTR